MSARLTKTEYERVVVDKLRFYLMERGWDIRHRGNRIVVEDVLLDGPGAVRMIAIFFREQTRTECLLGWRYPATEADSDAMDDDDVERPAPWEEGLRGAEQAEEWAVTFVLRHFQEQVEALGHGLPSECDPDGVTSVGKY